MQEFFLGCSSVSAWKYTTAVLNSGKVVELGNQVPTCVPGFVYTRHEWPVKKAIVNLSF